LFTLFTLFGFPDIPAFRNAEQLEKTFVLADISVLLCRPRGRGRSVVGRRGLWAGWWTLTVVTTNAATLKLRAPLHIAADLRVIIDSVCGESPLAMGTLGARLWTTPFIQTA
jgi:hypothetical protein